MRTAVLPVFMESLAGRRAGARIGPEEKSRRLTWTGLPEVLVRMCPFASTEGSVFARVIGEKMSESDPWVVLTLFCWLFRLWPSPTPDASDGLTGSGRSGGEGGGRRPTADCDRWAEAFARESIREIGDMTVNDFVPVLSDQVEALGPLLESMRRAGSFACSMTGSGPSCFALFEHREQRDEAHRKLARDFPGIRWFATALSCQAESLPC